MNWILILLSDNMFFGLLILVIIIILPVPCGPLFWLSLWRSAIIHVLRGRHCREVLLFLSHWAAAKKTDCLVSYGNTFTLPHSSIALCICTIPLYSHIRAGRLKYDWWHVQGSIYYTWETNLLLGPSPRRVWQIIRLLQGFIPDPLTQLLFAMPQHSIRTAERLSKKISRIKLENFIKMTKCFQK